MSVRRKTSRVQTGMKSVGIRSVDDLFKAATGPLVQFIELKAAMEGAMVRVIKKLKIFSIFKTAWNEESGIGVTGTIRQGMVRLHARAMKEGISYLKNVKQFSQLVIFHRMP